MDKWKHWARAIRRDAHALYLAARDPRVPWYAKAVAIAVAAYALSPIDLIPDFIPVLGYLDDLIIVPLGIALVVRMIPPPIMAEHRATADAHWSEQAHRAFDWFLGWNDLGLELYSPTTGGCRDALHVDRVNRNQGAESTLAFLLALAEMQLMQNAGTAFNNHSDS